ncbi:MAG: dipeptidase [Tyzzerella sp.]|nr:dipeptidase [Tyzzerella sp.]
MRLIDMHCDTFWLMMRTQGIGLQKNDLCIDIEKMKAAGSMAQFFASFIHMSEFNGGNSVEEAYQHALDMIAYGKAELAKCSDSIAIARNYDELIANCDSGKMSAILTLEEGGVINGKMEYLEELYCQGIRLITLTWNYENSIGFPNSREPELMRQGLKPFGIEVVKRMNDLGMIIDVSHLSDGGFWDVVRYSTKPFVASHSNARVLCNHPRNLTDEMIKALAEKGGVAGVNFYPYFLHESGKATVEDIAEHLWHMYQVGGEDVVAFGTDFDGFDEGELDITHMGEMNLVYDAIMKRGFTHRQMEKILSGNILRVLRDM